VANERGEEWDVDVVVELHKQLGRFCLVLMQLMAKEVANVAVDLVKIPICHLSKC
jgi:predicted nucleotidyltransferase